MHRARMLAERRRRRRAQHRHVVRRRQLAEATLKVGREVRRERHVVLHHEKVCAGILRGGQPPGAQVRLEYGADYVGASALGVARWEEPATEAPLLAVGGVEHA